MTAKWILMLGVWVVFQGQALAAESLEAGAGVFLMQAPVAVAAPQPDMDGMMDALPVPMQEDGVSMALTHGQPVTVTPVSSLTSQLLAMAQQEYDAHRAEGEQPSAAFAWLIDALDRAGVDAEAAQALLSERSRYAVSADVARALEVIAGR